MAKDYYHKQLPSLLKTSTEQQFLDVLDLYGEHFIYAPNNNDWWTQSTPVMVHVSQNNWVIAARQFNALTGAELWHEGVVCAPSREMLDTLVPANFYEFDQSGLHYHDQLRDVITSPSTPIVNQFIQSIEHPTYLRVMIQEAAVRGRLDRLVLLEEHMNDENRLHVMFYAFNGSHEHIAEHFYTTELANYLLEYHQDNDEPSCLSMKRYLQGRMDAEAQAAALQEHVGLGEERPYKASKM